MAMNKKIVTAVMLFCALGFSVQLKSQLKYWVKFTDKNGTPYSIGNPSAFLTSQSIARRTSANIAIDQTDLPVTPSYIAQVDNIANVTVLYASKWINGVVVSVPSATVLNAVTALAFVTNTTAVNKYRLDMPDVKETTAAAASNFRTASNESAVGYNYGGSYWQNHQLNVDCLHNLGCRGQGITIAILDAGFANVDQNPLFDTVRSYGNIYGTRDFVSGGTNVYDDDSHGAAVFSCLAANKPGLILGSAPLANYWLLRTEDANSEKIIEEYNWIRGAEFADSVGARILTTSLGYTDFDNNAPATSTLELDGRTAPMSIAATMASRKGMFVLNAAGNEGANNWHFIGVPADADSICTVGAIDSLGVVAAFSSVGPTADGRIKPDLVARGVGAWISSPTGECSQGNGTSFATPILAGAVACFMNAHQSFSNMRLLDTLKRTASNANNPNNSQGWGKPNLCAFPVGIFEIKASPVEFSVFPNPFNNLITISLSAVSYKINSVELVDLMGKAIVTENQNLSDSKINLSTNGLPAGVYFVRLNTSAGVMTRKIIKY
jgi:serine protease AprX